MATLFFLKLVHLLYIDTKHNNVEVFMKKAVVLSLMIVCIFLAGCAGGGKYGDVKRILTDYIDASKKFETDMEKANDPKTVAAALKAYTNAMNKMSPQIEKIPEKYPELAGPEPPEELKSLINETERWEDVFEKFYNKIMGYSADPEVEKALEGIGF
jgi:hypothetical protein